MPKVYITQIPHTKDHATGAFVPKVNVSPAAEYGELVVMMPPRAPFFATTDLVKQLREHLEGYDYEAGDALLSMGDPVIMAAAAAILGSRGPFTVLKWDRQLGRYVTARIRV